MTSFSDKKSLLTRLGMIKHVALDMDGTIYKGDYLFPFTVPFLQQLKSKDIGYSFLTNNPSKSRNDYIVHLKKMGLYISRKELYTTVQATIGYLISNHPDAKRLFILGTPSMISEFEQAGFYSVPDDPKNEPDAVVVGFDTTLSYNRLARAAWWINKNKLYVATNPDYVCPTDQPVTLVDCGSICAALEKATNRNPDAVLGKPHPEMIYEIMKANGLESDQVMMVGDRIYTDIQMAHQANVLGVLVLTGEATLHDAEQASPKPQIVTSSLETLGELIVKSHSVI